MTGYKKNEIDKLQSQRLAEIADDILCEKKIDRDELADILSTNRYADEFLNNLSSEDYHRDTNEMLEKAYEQRDCGGFIARLKREKRRNKIGVIVKLTASVAACLVLMFVLYNPESENSVEYLNQISYGDEIKSPTLFYSDECIELDTTTHELVVSEYIDDNEGVELIDEDEKIVRYEPKVSRLVVPKGYIHKIVLQDSTEVILNSNSELKFPNSFNGENSRVVTLSGEGYFNVKKSSKPFIVNVNSIYVKVYGTSFNVNGRKNEVVSVVLVEGAVGVGGENMKEVRMLPNQVAVLNLKENTSYVEFTNPEDYLGWLKGLFKYSNASFNTVMTDLSVWYNVDFKYDRKKYRNIKINMSLYRINDIEDILMLIETTNNVKFIKERSNEYSIVDSE